MNTLYRTTGLICLLAWLTTSNADDIDPQAAEAQDWINSTALSEPLQQVLDETVNALLEKDKRARKAKIGVALGGI